MFLLLLYVNIVTP